MQKILKRIKNRIAWNKGYLKARDSHLVGFDTMAFTQGTLHNLVISTKRVALKGTV